MSCPTPLFGQKQPLYLKEKESVEDRLILYLVAQGANDSEIADKLNCGVQKVSNLRRQPWFMEALLAIVHEHGSAAIEKRLQAVTPELIEMGMELARNAQKEEVRTTNIYNLLRVARGDKVVVQDDRKSPAELRAKRVEMEKQLKELRGENEPASRAEPSEDNGEIVTGSN